MTRRKVGQGGSIKFFFSLVKKNALNVEDRQKRTVFIIPKTS